MSKIRLDVYLHDNGYFDSREKARIAIMEGKVFVNNQKEDKPGTMIKEDAEVLVKDAKLKYVSRGGYKLEKAINVFNIDLKDKVCVDIGSSTGGFTDCMLQNAAKKVYAVDCGTNQLDYRLRTDDSVIVMENTNARYLTKEMLNKINDDDTCNIDFITSDVSFISLTKIIPVIKDLLVENGESVLLIKPQFEAGKELVEKNGVIKDKKIHVDVIKKIIDFCREYSFVVKGLDFSPIKGPAGNIEYLLYIKNDESKDLIDDKLIEYVVKESHEKLE